jgi:hypothetical protein
MGNGMRSDRETMETMETGGYGLRARIQLNGFEEKASVIEDRMRKRL